MASVTYDGRSFMLDGRRVWLVGGSIHYARLPRQAWISRLHAARHAGLNTVEAPVVWSRHEPRAGIFDFREDNDLRHFVQLAGEAGMHVILRLGPYVGSGYDAGGLPAWLLAQKGVSPRTNNSVFLEACSRYISAVAEQIRDLQVDSPGRGGPILLIQSEHSWTCGHDDLARTYLGELLRYIREAGLKVPVINANALWQAVEGEIECWSGADELFSVSRQLAHVQPKQPRLIVDLRTGQPDVWGRERPIDASPTRALRAMAEALAGASQFVLNPFAGGTNFAFSGGRLAIENASFVTSRHDAGALLDEAGNQTPAYLLARRLATFASRFAKVFAHADPEDRPVVLDPASTIGPTIVHSRGTQGSVAFILGQPLDDTPGKKHQPRQVPLLLADGSTIHAPLPSTGVAWCLFDTLLGGRAHLDYCSLCAFASMGPVFVCFGPEGSTGVVSVNGSPLEVHVPGGKKPNIIHHEGAVIVVCSETQVDHVYLAEDSVILGADGISSEGAPIAPAGVRTCTTLTHEGTVVERRAVHPAQPAPAKIPLGAWSTRDAHDFASGQSPRYAAIGGPLDLTALGAPYGYGWYRLTIKPTSAKRVRVASPGAGDRLHIYLDGTPEGILGVGPGAASEITLGLKKSTRALVVLAENAGRAAAGTRLDSPKGLHNHLWEVAPLKTPKHKLADAAPLELLKFRAPMWEVRVGDATHASRITWVIQHRRRTPLLVRFTDVPWRGLLILNDQTVLHLEPGSDNELFIDPERLARGNNTLQVALAQDAVPEGELEAAGSQLARGLHLLECVSCLSEKAEWSFAQWEPPSPSAFAARRTSPPPAGIPAWHRVAFHAPAGHDSLVFHADGLTKGQLYLNGRHLCRYIVASPTGEAVPPQREYLLPAAWLLPGEHNDLTIFDEHGGDPAKCRVTPLAPHTPRTDKPA